MQVYLSTRALLSDISLVQSALPSKTDWRENIAAILESAHFLPSICPQPSNSAFSILVPKVGNAKKKNLFASRHDNYPVNRP